MLARGDVFLFIVPSSILEYSRRSFGMQSQLFESTQDIFLETFES